MNTTTEKAGISGARRQPLDSPIASSNFLRRNMPEKGKNP